jgi:RNA polymerase sigma-70 factor (ECF subfamily)
MADDLDPRTSTSLLRRLRHYPRDESAWSEFADRYGRLTYRWCQKWGLQKADAEDVTQNVMIELARQMQSFVYDRGGSFRGWLRTIAYRSWIHFVDERRRKGHQTASLDLERICSPAAGEDFLAQLEKESDRELLERATSLVRLRVEPHTWEAFRLTAVDGKSGAETAETLGMKPGAVFVARSKVQRMLRETVRRLDGEM